MATFQELSPSAVDNREATGWGGHAQSMFDPVILLERFGGVARGSFLQRYGCSRHQLAREADDGRIVRVRPGVYALPEADPSMVTAAAHGGELTCTEALRRQHVWVLPDSEDSVHVWLGAAGRRHDHDGCRCTTHYSPGRAGLGVASTATALIHAFRCLSHEAFFAAYESAWNLRLISASDRARIRREVPRSVHWLLDVARPDAQSGLESLLRLRLHLLGIRLDCQVQIEGVGRVDFVIEGRLILEVDGREHHDGPSQRHRDLRRDAEASARGYESLRFDYALVVHDWDTVVAAILPALQRARA